MMTIRRQESPILRLEMDKTCHIHFLCSCFEKVHVKKLYSKESSHSSDETMLTVTSYWQGCKLTGMTDRLRQASTHTTEKPV